MLYKLYRHQIMMPSTINSPIELCAETRSTCVSVLLEPAHVSIITVKRLQELEYIETNYIDIIAHGVEKSLTTLRKKPPLRITKG